MRRALRTRARAAALWVIWSPRRALGTAAAVAVVATIGMSITAAGAMQDVVRSHAAGQQRAAAAGEERPTGRITLPALDTPTGGASTLPAPDASGRVPADASRAASEWVQLWLTRRTTKDLTGWLDAMTRRSAPGLVPFLSATAPEAIPAATVTSVDTLHGGSTSAVIAVHLSTGQVLDLTLLPDTKGVWRVDDVQPEQAAGSDAQ